uniref:Kinesin light chain n=1 Tax=Trichobilharzia regenti TaxID=157069 RepID=A0AA85KA43_TRIRE|nr:unnamed protein product [Trichobilharzia regenti]
MTKPTEETHTANNNISATILTNDTCNNCIDNATTSDDNHINHCNANANESDTINSITSPLTSTLSSPTQNSSILFINPSSCQGDKLNGINITTSEEYLIQLKNLHLKLTSLNHKNNYYHKEFLNQLSNINTIQNKLNTWDNFQLNSLIKNQLDVCIHSNIDLMYEIIRYTEKYECEQTRLSLQYKRLIEENLWLSNEYNILNNKLNKLNESIKEYEAQRIIQHYKYKMRKNADNNSAHNTNTGDQYKCLTESNLSKPNGLFDDDFIKKIISAKMKALYRLTIKYINEGRLDIAIAMCTQLLQDRSKASELTPIDFGVINLLLGVVLSQQKRHLEAITSIEDALKIFEMKVGKEHTCLVDILRQLTHEYVQLGNYKTAEKHLKRAILIKKSITQDKHSEEVMQYEIDLADILLHNQKYTETIELSKDCLKYLRNEYEPEQRNTIIMVRLNILLGKAYLKLGQIDTAYQQIRYILKEALDREATQLSIIDLFERRQYTNTTDKALLQATVYDLYSRLGNEQQIDILKILQAVYKAQNNEYACEQLENFLNTFYPVDK